MSSSPDTVRPGLRERKKAKTRAAIQRHALRLFDKQGYHATTVEQIADAAEVSPSTFFRYFPTKEDVVLHDELDPRMIESLRAQPPELSPLAALRRTLKEVFAGLTEAEAAHEAQRHKLVRSVPELRARTLDQYASGMDLLSEAFAERLERRADDIAIRALAGAVIGVGMAVILTIEDRPADFVELFDAHLAQLEAGLGLR
jgi:AcrR family transcriptional regulator